MIPKVDSGWLKIFEQKGWIYLCLALFSAALRYLLGNNLLPTLERFIWLADISLLGAILFGILAIGSAGHWVSNWIKLRIRSRKVRKTVLSRLNSLSEVEHRILSYLIQKIASLSVIG